LDAGGDVLAELEVFAGQLHELVLEVGGRVVAVAVLRFDDGLELLHAVPLSVVLCL
jgi:hypothetical protein